jgi:hypothetical protein
MKSFLVGLGVGVGLGVLFAPGRGEDTRRELGERLHGIADDAQRKAKDPARRVCEGLDNESYLDSDDLICELPPKKEQGRETFRPSTSSAEGSDVVDPRA